MSLAPAPHTPPVFRVLKQAWREYLATNTAAIITVNTPASLPASTALTVTGTIVCDPSIPLPVYMTAALYQTPTVFKGWVYGYADRWTGAYSLVWPANASVAGTHFIQVWSEIGYFPVQSANFTLT